MFERSKKDKSDQDPMAALRGDVAQGDGDWQPSPAPKNAATSSARTEVAVIGRSIRIDGDLRGEEDLLIEGDVNGTVQLRNNTLTIGSEGKISANVYAKSVTVDGLMQGDVFGSERVSIRKNARVDGNITAARVSIEDGAKFKGSIEMDPAVVEKQLGTTKSAASDRPTQIATKDSADKRVAKTGGASYKGGAKNESVV